MRLYHKRQDKDYKQMTKLSLVAFLCEVPNLVITVISALISYTPVVWVDAINSLGETMHCFIVYLVTKGLQKNNEDKYNFGVERVETLSSFCCDVLVCIGMVSVAFGAIFGIINPTSPADNLVVFVLIKLVNSLWDLSFLLVAIKAAKKAKSKLGNSEIRNYAKALAFDLIIGVVVGITYFFRASTWICYANPIVSIIIVSVFVVIYIKKMKESIEELTDKSISVFYQDQVFDIILGNAKVIKQIEEINIRHSNTITYIDVCVVMHDDVTYKTQTEYLDYIRKEIDKIIPDAVVKLVIGQNDYK